jgi:hypothetical protein
LTSGKTTHCGCESAVFHPKALVARHA